MGLMAQITSLLLLLLLQVSGCLMRPNDLPEDGELNSSKRSFNQGWALLSLGGVVGGLSYPG